MTRQAFQDDAVFDEIHRLATACLEGDATITTFDLLKEAVSRNPAALDLYVEYLSDSIALRCVVPTPQEAEGSDFPSLTDMETDDSVNSPVNLLQQATSPRFPFLTSTLHSPIGSCSSWPVAYFIATVIFGIGALIGAFTHVSHPVQVAGRLPAVVSTPGAKMELVGQITSMVDCQWVDPQNTPATKTVYLDHNYALASGLLEITYNSGAKVILQGPVTYKVESTNGGYLSLGKLTARVDSAKSQTADPQSPSSSPLFAIRTPTAVVTDLGTEFGVEVDKHGSTTSHVFRGVVEVQACMEDGQQKGSAVQLKENESVRVTKPKKGNDTIVEVYRDKTVSSAFVSFDQLNKRLQKSTLKPMQRWQAYSSELRNDPALVVYYTFESVGRDSWLLSNTAETGAALDAIIEGPLWTSGRMPGKLALRFRGSDTNDKVVLPEQHRFNFTTPFSIAVWFKAAPFQPGSVPTLINKSMAWRLQRLGNEKNILTMSTNSKVIDGKHYNLPPASTEVTDGRWHHVVVVIEPSETSHHKRLYMDGRLEGEVEVPTPLLRSNAAVWMGQSSMFADREYEGLIDEVAILARALSADEIKTMYDAGNPANPSVQGTNNDQ